MHVDILLDMFGKKLRNEDRTDRIILRPILQVHSQDVLLNNHN